MVYPAPSFEPLATLEAIAEERCTSIYGVPTMWIAQLEHPQFDEFDLTSLRTGVMAGAPCPVEVMKRAVSDMHAPRGLHRLRHDRDRAGLVHDAPATTTSNAGSPPSAGSSRTSRQSDRPGDRRDGARGALPVRSARVATS